MSDRPGRGLSPEVASGVRYAAYLLRCWQDLRVWSCPAWSPSAGECHPTVLGCLAAALDAECDVTTPASTSGNEEDR